MTASKDQCHLALPDLDPSIALAQAARQDFERPTVHQLIEQATREHAEFTVALLWRSGAWLKSFFVPVHIQDSGVIVVNTSITRSAEWSAAMHAHDICTVSRASTSIVPTNKDNNETRHRAVPN